MNQIRFATLVSTLALLAAAAPAQARTVLYAPPACTGAPTDDAGLLACYAPLVLAPETEEAHNRIATPRMLADGDDFRFLMDSGRPTLYAEIRSDSIAGREVRQLVYRFHFERIPLRLSKFVFEAHRNPGLLVIVTLDAASDEALFVTTAHTCGCYRGTIPTTAFAPAALPSDHPGEALRLYGERLPARVEPPRGGHSRVLLELRADNHRVTRLAVVANGPAAAVREPLPLEPMASLRALPVEGAPGREQSMFYTSGPLRGKVRGAWNPLEGLTVFGLVSLDPTVGMDKDFGDPEETGTPFYTMLRFWKHDASRLDRFDSMLRQLGYRLDELGGGMSAR